MMEQSVKYALYQAKSGRVENIRLLKGICKESGRAVPLLRSFLLKCHRFSADLLHITAW